MYFFAANNTSSTTTLRKLRLKNSIQTNSHNESINNVTSVPKQLHQNFSSVSKSLNDENFAIQKLRNIADGKNISNEVSDVPSEVG